MQRTVSLGLLASAGALFLSQPVYAEPADGSSAQGVAVAGRTGERPAPVVGAAELESLQADGHLLLVLVAGGEVARPDVPPRHIDLAVDLTGPRSGPGLYPPPTTAQLAALSSRLGLTDETRIVLASEGHVRDAARAWLVLRWAGFDNVAVLDGGVAAATDIAPEAARRDAPGAGRILTLRGGGLPVLDADGARRFGQRGALIDARVNGLYLAGHIPGAINLPAPLLLAEDGKLLPKSALEALFVEHRLRSGQSVAVYGNGGVGAAVLVLALAAADYPVSFYWDGWPDWQSDPHRPIAFGGEPLGTPSFPSPSE